MSCQSAARPLLHVARVARFARVGAAGDASAVGSDRRSGFRWRAAGISGARGFEPMPWITAKETVKRILMGLVLGTLTITTAGIAAANTATRRVHTRAVNPQPPIRRGL